ncbi:MAG: FkbM family methyltransferase [Kiritimatiellae bacterium]|jgi:hypothetical protein|nr:FkbM family methyltransferase [Kiritimatiellia bacterium]
MGRESHHTGANIVLKQLLQYLVPMRVYLLTAKRAFSRSACNNKLTDSVQSDWSSRITDVLSAPDNLRIERVADAGRIIKDILVMHNGVKIYTGSYYGDGMLELLVNNRGVHEPQEEFVFNRVIESLPEKCTMIELGAYWSFYSLSLLNKRPFASCYMVEPVKRNLASGLLNFRLNGCDGVFVNAGVGGVSSRYPKVVTVDSLCEKYDIDFIDILHSDIQGNEVLMLDGAEKALGQKKVGWWFISTHSNSLHEECVQRLQQKGYEITASVNLEETYSFDGLIVANLPELSVEEELAVSMKTASE